MRKIVFLMALLSSLAFANYELERQCNNGNAGSCFDLGNLYFKGDGVKQDYKKAMEFWSKACEMGDAGSCYNLGCSYHLGDGVKQDYKKAREFYNKACEMGEALGCNNLGKLYKNGNTSESKYVGKGIVGNILEYLYESRNGVRQDYNKAMEFFGKACDLGDQDACMLIEQ